MNLDIPEHKNLIVNQEEQDYLNLLEKILITGESKEDRTGIGTKSIFGTMLKFSLKNNTIPLLTTKKMFTKGIIEELLFFVRGDTNTKHLEELGVNIWKGNTSKEFLKNRGLDYPEGEMGPLYRINLERLEWYRSVTTGCRFNK